MYTIRKATAEEMHEICKIRYDAYRKAGLIEPNSMGMLEDIYDHSGAPTTLVAVKDCKIIGTIRCLPDSRLGLPMDDEGFGPQLAPYREMGRLIEVGRFAILPDYQPEAQGLARQLCVHAILHAIISDFDYMVIMVVDHHIKFYKKFFMFEQLAITHESKYHENVAAMYLELDSLTARYENNKLARR